MFTAAWFLVSKIWGNLKAQVYKALFLLFFLFGHRI